MQDPMLTRSMGTSSYDHSALVINTSLNYRAGADSLNTNPQNIAVFVQYPSTQLDAGDRAYYPISLLGKLLKIDPRTRLCEVQVFLSESQPELVGKPSPQALRSSFVITAHIQQVKLLQPVKFPLIYVGELNTKEEVRLRAEAISSAPEYSPQNRQMLSELRMSVCPDPSVLYSDGVYQQQRCDRFALNRENIIKTSVMSSLTAEYHSNICEYLDGMYEHLLESFTQHALPRVCEQLCDDIDGVVQTALELEKELKMNCFNIKQITEILQDARDSAQKDEYAGSSTKFFTFKYLILAQQTLVPLYIAVAGFVVACELQLSGNIIGFMRASKIVSSWHAQCVSAFCDRHVTPFIDFVSHFDEHAKQPSFQSMDDLVSAFDGVETQFPILEPLRFTTQVQFEITNNKIIFSGATEKANLENIQKTVEIMGSCYHTVFFKDKYLSLVDVVSNANPAQVQDQQLSSLCIEQLNQTKLQAILETCDLRTDGLLRLVQQAYPFADLKSQWTNLLQYDTQVLSVLKLVGEQTHPKDSLLFQTEELEKLHVFSRLDDYQFSYVKLQEQFSALRALKITVNMMRAASFSNTLYTISTGEEIQKLDRHIDHELQLEQQQVQNIIQRVEHKLIGELKHLRGIVAFGQTAPKYFKIVKRIQEIMGQKAKHIHIQLSSLFEKLIDGFISSFCTNQVPPFFVYSTSIDLAYLVKECKGVSFVTEKYPELVYSILQAHEKFIFDASADLVERIKEIMLLNVVDTEEMQSNPIKVSEKYARTCSNIKMPQVTLNSKETEKNETEAILACLHKSIILKVEVPGYDIPALLKRFTPMPQLVGQLVPVLEMYERADYSQHTIATAPPLLLHKVLMELKYTLQQLLILQQNIKWFRAEIKKIDPGIGPDLIDMTRSIAPIAECSSCLELLFSRHGAALDQKIIQYPAADELMVVERLSRCVKLIRRRAQTPFIINSSEKQIIVSYDTWLDFALFVEDSLLKLSPSVYFIYMLQCENYTSEQLLDLEKLIGDSFRHQTAAKILEQMEQNNILFDKVVTYWVESQINNAVDRQLNKVIIEIQNVLIESVFSIQSFNYRPVNAFELIKQAKNEGNNVDYYWKKYINDQYVDLSRIRTCLIVPVYVETLCTETQVYLGQILNNYDFQDGDTNLQSQLLLEMHLVNATQILSTKIKLAERRYSIKIEQKCRDVENVIQVMKMLNTCLTRIPNILSDLIMIYYNGSPVKIDQRHKINISVLTIIEQIEIIDAQKEWQFMLDQYMIQNSRTRMFDLAMNTEFCQKLTKLSVLLQRIHQKQLKYDYAQLIRQISAPFDIKLKQFNEDHQLQPYLSIGNSNVPKKIIPSIKDKYYPLANLIPLAIQVKFSNFDPKINQLKYWSSLQYELMPNINSITLDNGKITHIISHEEQLKLDHPQAIPEAMIYIFDTISDIAAEQIQRSIRSAFDVLFERIRVYKKLREGHATVYYADLDNKSKWEELDSYFQCFELFFNNYPFQAQIIAIATIISQIYQVLYQKALTNLVEKIEFRSVYFLINDLCVCVQLIPGKETHWRKAVLCKLSEWREIFECAMPLMMLRNTVQMMQKLPQFVYQIYDLRSDRVVTMDSHQTLQVRAGSHWLGAPTLIDTNLRLNQQQHFVMTRIAQGFTQSRTVVLCGFDARHYQNLDALMFAKSASRLFSRRLITVLITESNFTQGLIRISTGIAAGYIVLLYGVEFLKPNQINEINALVGAIFARKGILPGLVVAHDISKQLIEVSKTCAVETNIAAKLQIRFQDAQLEDFDDPGLLIMFVPSLSSVQTSIEFSFASEKGVKDAKLKLDENQKKMNAMVQYQECYHQNLSFNLQNMLTINIETIQPLQFYLDISAEYGRSFYELSTFLKQQKYSIARLTFTDLKVILQRVRDTKDSCAVATVTLDFIMKQCLNMLVESEAGLFIPVLANYVAVSFGLDKLNSQIIIKQAVTYQKYQQQLLVMNGLSKAPTTKQMQEKLGFTEYYSDYLQRQSNQQYTQFLNFFSGLHQIPIECMYDIFFVHDLLKDQKPVLLVSHNLNYVNVFLSLLSVRSCTNLVRVFSSQQLSNELREPQTKLLAIQPSTIDDLLKILPKVFGLFLPFPIVEDEQNQPLQISELTQIPLVVLCISLHQFHEFIQHPICKLFLHKAMLFPFMENAEGMRKIMINNLKVSEHQYSSITKFATSHFKSHENLQFVTSSLVIQEVMNQMQHKMLVVAEKDAYEKQIHEKLKLLPQVFNSIFTISLQIALRIFGVGKAVEEILIIRSCVYFFLTRFNIVKPCRQPLQTEFADLAFKEMLDLIKDENLRQQHIKRQQLTCQNQLGYNVFSRYVAQKYIQLHNQELVEHTAEKIEQLQSRAVIDSISTERQFIGEFLVPKLEVCGFLAGGLSIVEQRAKKESQSLKMNAIVLQEKERAYEQTEQQSGHGSNGSIQFEFAPDFVINAFLKEQNSLKHMEAAIFSAIWNAISLYYLTIHTPGKEFTTDSQKTYHKIMSFKYEQFISTVAQFRDVPACVISPLQQLIKGDLQMILELSTPNLPQVYGSSTFSYIHYSGGLNKDKTSKNYDSYESNLEFLTYQLGKGVVNNITADSDYQMVVKSVQEASKKAVEERLSHMERIRLQKLNLQQKSTKKQENLMYDQIMSSKQQANIKKQMNHQNANPYLADSSADAQNAKINLLEFQTKNELLELEQLNIDFENLCAQFDTGRQISVQRLSECGLHFDEHRVALAVVLGCAFFSPLSFCLVGKPCSGKSTLLNVAKLLVRDFCYFDQSLLVDCSTIAIDNQLRNQFVKNCIQRSQQLFQNKKMQSVTDVKLEQKICQFIQSYKFPCLHIKASSCTDSPTPNIISLIRDHIIVFDDAVQIDNQFQLNNGALIMQDQSIVVETTENCKLTDLCSVVISMPPLTEQYLIECLSKKQSNNWVKQFINGVQQIKTLIPDRFQDSYSIYNEIFEKSKFAFAPNSKADKANEQTQLYETQGYTDNNVQVDQTAYQRVKQSKDDQLTKFSVHCLLEALEQLGCDKSLITEQLASLCLLKKMKINGSRTDFAETPWSDSQLILDKNFNLKFGWVAYIIQLGMQNSKRGNSQDDENNLNPYADLVKKSQKVHIPISEFDFHGLVNEQQLINLKSTIPNSFYIVDLCELFRLYGQKQEPFSIIKAFETTFAIELHQSYTNSFVNHIIAFGNRSDDEYFALRNAIEAQCVSKSSLFTNQIGDAYTNLRSEDRDKMPFEPTKQQFIGFPFSSQLYLQPMKIMISINQLGTSAYQNFVHQVAYVGRYKIYGWHKMGENDKIIIDTREVMKMIQKESEFDNLQIAQMMKEMTTHLQQVGQFTDEQINFIQLMTILRVSVALSLGIKPSLVLVRHEQSQTSFQQLFGLQLKSHLQSFFPSKSIQNGRNMSQLPFSCYSQTDLEQRFEQYCKVDSIEIAEHNQSLKRLRSLQLSKYMSKSKFVSNAEIEVMQETLTQQQLLDNLVGPCQKVMLVSSSSTLNEKTKIGSTLLMLLNQLLEASNSMHCLFDQEELQAITSICSHRLKLGYAMSQESLQILLSTNFSVVVLNNTPNDVVQASWKNFGIIQNPILQLLKDYQQKYKDILIQQQRLQQQRTGTSAQQQFQQQINEKTKSKYELYTIKKLQDCKLNVVNITSLDMFALFKMSQCELPEEVQLPVNMEIDWTFYKSQFVVASVALYTTFKKYSTGSTVSLSKFTFVSAKICNLLLKRVELYLQELTVIQGLLKYYKNISEPIKSQVKEVDIQTTNFEEVKEQVTTMIEQQVEQMKRGQKNIPTKQIQLQTAANEAVFIRNYLHSIELVMQKEMSRMSYILKTAHILAVACASYIFFGATQLINFKTAKQEIQNGSFGDIDVSIEELLAAEADSLEVDIFNIFVITVLYNTGFYVVHPDVKKRKQIPPQFTNLWSETSKFMLGITTLNYGRALYLNEVIDILDYDWPIYMILKSFETEWEPNDPQYSMISSVMLNYTLGFKFFIIPDIICNQAACSIAATFNNKKYYQVTSQSLQLKKESEKQPCVKLTHELMQNITNCDVESLYTNELKKNIIDCLETGKILVIRNFGSIRSNIHNISIIKHLLNTIIHHPEQSQITYSNVTIKLKSQIKNQIIVFGVSQERIDDETYCQYNIYTQSMIDQIIKLFHPDVLQNKSIRSKQQQYKQKLVQNIFSEEDSARSRKEMLKICNQAIHTLIESSYKLFLKYIRQFILTIMFTAEEISRFRIDYGIIQRLQQLSTYPDQVQKILLNLSYIYLNNDVQKDMLDEIAGMMRGIVVSQTTIEAIQCENEQNDDVVQNPVQLQFVFQYLLQSQAQTAIEEFTSAVATTLQFVGSICYRQRQVLAISENDLFNDIFYNINQSIQQYKQDLAKRYGETIQVDEINKQNIYVFRKFPLLYHIKHEQMGFKAYLASCAVQTIIKRIMNMFSFYYGKAVSFRTAATFMKVIGLVNQTEEQLKRGWCQTQDDFLRLSVAYNLNTIFNNESVFSISKINEELPQVVDNIDQVVPKITQMSAELQNVWLKLSIMGRYDVNMAQTLPWYAINHASLVSLVRSRNQFLSMQLFMGFMKDTTSNNQYKVEIDPFLDVPPGIRQVDFTNCFGSFITATIITPQHYERLLHEFMTAPINVPVIGSSFDSPLPQLSINGRNSGEIPSQQQIGDVIKPAMQTLNSILGVHGVHYEYDVISDVIGAVVSLIIRTPKEGTVINTVFYDDGILVRPLLEYIHDQLTHTQFCYYVNAERQQTQPLFLEVSAARDGEVQLRALLEVMLRSKAALIRLQPIYLIIRAADKPAAGFSDVGVRRIHPQEITFIAALKQIFETAQARFVYLKDPESPSARFKHVLCVASIAAYQCAQKRRMRPDFIYEHTVASIRGLCALMFRKALIKGADDDVYFIIQQIFERTVIEPKLCLKGAPVQATALADQAFFASSLTQFQGAAFNSHQVLADVAFKKFLCGDPTLLDHFLPRKLAVSVQKKLSINTKIRDRMNVQVEEESAHEGSDAGTDRGSIAQSMTSMSEISDESKLDFDDSMSMFSHQSKNTNRNSVVTATTQKTTTTHRTGKTTQSSASSSIAGKLDATNVLIEPDEQSPYKNLLSDVPEGLALDLRALEGSLASKLFGKQRKIKAAGGAPGSADVEEHSDYSAADQKQVEQLIILPMNSAECDPMTSIQQLKALEETKYESMQRLQKVLFPNVVRRVFNHETVQDTQHNRQADLERMPDLFRGFIQNLLNYSNVNWGASSRQLAFSEIERGLVRQQTSQEDNATLGTRGFGHYAEHWVVSAVVFGPVLGDIFLFLKMMNAVAHCAPVYRQKVVLLVDQPYKPPRMLDNGDIDLGRHDKKQPQFFVKVRGLELVGLCWDRVLESVVDGSPEHEQGYLQVIDLYAVPIVLESWTAGVHDPNVSDEALLVSPKFVPVPVRCGGAVLPIAMLPNKTGIPSEELAKRGAYLAVRDM